MTTRILKKLIAGGVSTALIFLLTANNTVFAQTPTSTLKKAVEDIKDNIETLITAKDEGTEDLAFRAETFKKIINLSLTETQDLKIKLLAFESDEKQINLWKTETLGKIAEAAKYFEKQKSDLENQKDLTLDWIKTAAQNFKDWREQNYLPVSGQGFDFLLIQQEKKAVEMAQNRLQKIKKDLESLKKYRLKNIKTLNEKMAKAAQLIENSAVTNDQAETEFWQSINATTTAEMFATTTPEKTENISAATSSAATSTPESAGENSKPSIRDLVKSSLNQIKEAYQIFIEMSNLVRNLLK